MTDFPKLLVQRLSWGSRFRFPVPLQPTGSLPVTFWVDHLVLDSACTSGPPEDELAHSSVDVLFSSRSLGSGCTCNELRDLLRGNLRNNFEVIRQPMNSIEAAHDTPGVVDDGHEAHGSFELPTHHMILAVVTILQPPSERTPSFILPSHAQRGTRVR